MTERDASPPGDLRRGTIPFRVFVPLRILLLGLGRVVLGLKLEGVSRVPRQGPLLIVSNHLHNADPLILSIACPRPVHFMAKEELLRIPVIGRIIRLSGSFPVRRGKSDRVAIRRSIETLRQEIALGMFPEGTRSRSWHLEQALSGAGLIAMMGKATIQPVAITGSETLPLNDSKGRKKSPWYRRFRVTVVFGEPFELPVTMADGSRMSAEAATELMMRRVASILPEQYRGVYGDS